MMDDRQNSPPKEVSPDASQGARANQQVSHDTTTNNANDNRSGGRQPYDVLAGNARHFAASRRIVRTCPTGGYAHAWRHGFSHGFHDALRLAARRVNDPHVLAALARLADEYVLAACDE